MPSVSPFPYNSVRFSMAAKGAQLFGYTISADTGQEGDIGESGDQDSKDEQWETKEGKIEIQVFAAASLSNVIEELALAYQQLHPQVSIVCNMDSSGTLVTQIREGYACDVFFSSAEKQMDQLEAEGRIVEGTRSNVVHNQVVVIAAKDSGTEVKGLKNFGDASSIALAGGSVPVGWYTRQALMNLGILEKTEEPSQAETIQISQALGGVEISEQDNVSKVTLAVAEGSCEVGTVYYSDIYGYEDRLDILEKVSYDLSGEVRYPAAQVVNPEADEKQAAVARDFITFLSSDTAKEIFEKYYFDPDVAETNLKSF